MSIRVTCPGCRTRFNVSDQFAGREGPCPKCKAKIHIPDKSEEVVIHGPSPTASKESKGAAISKPIFRQEMVISPVLWTVIVGVIITLFALALVLRFQIADKVNFPLWMLIVGSLIVAVPAVYAAYGMLRDSDLGAFFGKDLWIRICICAAFYAALWLAMPTAQYVLHGYDTLTWSLAMAAMIGIGGAVAMSVLDFDYIVGVLHYGMYLGCTLLLRWVTGVGVFPGQLRNEAEAATSAIWHAASQLSGQLI